MYSDRKRCHSSDSTLKRNAMERIFFLELIPLTFCCKQDALGSCISASAGAERQGVD